MQANLQRSQRATDELFLEARSRRVGFALVQEPYVGARGELKRYAGTRVVQCERLRTKPVKAAIVVFDDDIEVLNDQTTITENIVLTKLKTDKWMVVVVSVYFEDQQPLELYLEKLKEFLESVRADKVLIGGDVNAWSTTWWGSVAADERGALYEEFLDEMDMNILNCGTDPTFDTVRGGRLFTSNVDVTVCSTQLLRHITDWKVDKSVTSSDHNTITLNICLEKPSEKRKPPSTRVFNTRRADWGLFTEEVIKNLKQNNITLENIQKIKNRVHLEVTISKYINCIENACQNSIPKINNKNKKNYLPWWTDELERLKSVANTKRRRVRCAAPRRRKYVVEEYLKAKEQYELEAKKAQTASWKQFCTKQDRESMWDRVYRVIRCRTERHEDQLLEENGAILGPEESVQLLANTFFPDDNCDLDDEIHKAIRKAAGTICEAMPDDYDDPLFTMPELKRTLSSFDPKKAPGLDGFTADICFRAVFAEKEVFLGILNRCLILSCFPSPWKEAAVVILRKPGKSDYMQAKSYRPIGLLSILGKVFEKMVVRRIRWHLLPKANPRQYGFVPQRSTEDALYDLKQQIQINLQRKELMVIVSLDIEGAFDSAWWPSIKYQLLHKKCPLNLRRLVNSYFEDRKVVVNYAGNSFRKHTSKGCVQGSIGGPTFWNLLLDPLLDDLTARGVYVQAFADDVVLMFSGQSASKIQGKVNETLAYVHEWGIKNKLKFAAHKTNAMIVTKKLKFDTPIMRMGGVDIPVVNEIKLLGLTIDKKLTYNKHVADVCRKAANIYKQLARTAKIEWGLNPEIIRTIYVSVIEPIVMYASSVWAPAADKIIVQKQLNTIQRGFVQKICKAYKTVSLNAALVLAGLLPLDLRIREAAELYEAKRGRPTSLDYGKREIEERVSFLKGCHPAKEEDVNFICLNDMLPDTLEQHQLPKIQIYTDGSKLDGKVGAAYSYWKNGSETKTKKMRLESFCTVFQAELFALYQVTDFLLKEGEQDEVAVLSDSRSALQIVQDPENYHPLAFKIRRNLSAIKSKGGKIRLFWVKAHVGVPGNERADELAKQAALHLKTSAHYSKCPVSYAKSEIRKTTVQKWGLRYANGETAQTTKLFLPDVVQAHSILKKFKLTPLLTQVMTGHGGFSAYLNRFKCKETPSCACEPEKRETIEHLLLECPIHDADRYDLESVTNIKLTDTSLCEMMAGKETRPHLLAFCTKVAEMAVRRNKTR